MEGRTRRLLVRAAATGRLDFKECDFSRRWWLRCSFVANEIESEAIADLARDKLKVMLAIPEKDGAAIDKLIDDLHSCRVPWIKMPKRQDKLSESDSVAMWYLMNKDALGA